MKLFDIFKKDKVFYIGTVVVFLIAMGVIMFPKQSKAVLGDIAEWTYWQITSTGVLRPVSDLSTTLGDVSHRILGLHARDVYLSNAAAPKSYGERVYKRVYNRTGKTLTNGEVVCYYTASTVTIGGFAVDIETAPAGLGYQDYETIAGVIAETISPSSYGWMQIWGVHTAIKANYSVLTKPTVNYRIITSTRSGFACASTTSTTNIGIWLQTTTATTSTGTAIGFIKAMGN